MRVKQQIDETTATQIRLSLAKQATRGGDAVRALDELGHLLYPRRLRRIQADTLLQAADLLDQCTVKQLEGGYTPLDTKRAIAVWLRKQAEEMTVQEIPHRN